jgi:hypothetical protein
MFLILENDLCQGLCFGVRDAERDTLDAEVGGNFCGFAGEREGGAAALLADYFQVDPTNSAAPAGAERFHGGFFGGETASVSLELILEALAICDFVECEDTAEERLAMALNGSLDARDFGDIHT